MLAKLEALRKFRKNITRKKRETFKLKTAPSAKMVRHFGVTERKELKRNLKKVED